MKDFDERVTEQRETVEKIHADTKESQFRNKTMQRSLTEQSVKLATLKSRVSLKNILPKAMFPKKIHFDFHLNMPSLLEKKVV